MTSMKIETTGSPCLPGSKTWADFEAQKRLYREKIAAIGPIVDDKPPVADIRKEIDFAKLKSRAEDNDRRDFDNRVFLNQMSSILQNPSEVDSTNTTKKMESRRIKSAPEELTRTMKDNIEMAAKMTKIESAYDSIDMAIAWEDVRRQRLARLRYKPLEWRRVFERNRLRQEARGRSLDPNYRFRF